MKTSKTAYYNSKIGIIKIGYNSKSITSVDFVDNENDAIKSERSPLSDLAMKQIDEYLSNKRKVFDIPIEVEGTEFQKKVWKALQAIPYGQTLSYKQIAENIGNPKACRAVGNANNKNKISIIIPCHRVIGSNGNLYGYAGGKDIKQKLLEIEKNSN